MKPGPALCQRREGGRRAAALGKRAIGRERGARLWSCPVRPQPIGPAASRRRDDARESEEINDGARATQCPDRASPQETMALLSDASRWPDWYPGMTEVNIAAP